MLIIRLRCGSETVRKRSGAPPNREGWRRVIMVGVNMVLAEFVKFKHGLYQFCGIECFKSIVLEPCLLQPCLHIAG